MAAERVLHVVPHTHWDREWYEPFQVYRFWLVKMVDSLLDVLASDPGFRHFNFDGQTAAIEDYLAVRPEREAEVARFVREGRIAIGPWRILMDEFLCSPETIVRNLRQGRATAERLGRPMRLGYIPDSFGHISQMPQILRLAGLADACVYRGVPRAVDRTAFHWEAPDGSRVRALYLATTYSNAATLPESVEDLRVRAARIAEDLEPFKPGDVLLAMNGTDHRAPERHLPAVLAGANGAAGGLRFRIGSLEEYLADAPGGDDLPRWRGELRSGARANLIMGVASARMPLKQAEYAASRVLERYAEPLAAIAGSHPGTLLDEAWRAMVENSAHDSICGCGIDEVAETVAGRYEDVRRVATLVADDALASIAARVDAADLPEGREGALVFNPSPFERAGVATVTVHLPDGAERLAFRAPDGSVHRAQVTGVQEETAVDLRLTGAQLAAIIPTIHSRMIGPLYVNSLAVEPGPVTTVRMRLGPVPEGAFDVEEAKRAVERETGARPSGSFRVLGLGPAIATALVRTPPVGGLGWISLSPLATGAPAQPFEASASGAALDNGLVRAEVAADGSITLTGLRDGVRFEGALALEESGDAGDEYNYSPPERDLIVSTPDEAAVVDVVREGPIEARLRVRSVYRVPAGLDAKGTGRSRKRVAMPVTLDVFVRAGEPFLRAAISIDNRARDHRVRAIVPLPFPATHSHADGAFDVVERGLEAEGGGHEHGLATFPCRRWVDVSDGGTGIAVMHRGTPEYELAAGRALAITLLRSVGLLSRQGMAYRAGPAGPSLPVPGAQLLGGFRASLALYPHAGDWRAAGVHRVAESYAYGFRATGLRRHEGEWAPAAPALAAEPESVQLSALHRDGDGLVCRVYNASPHAVDARIVLGAPLQATEAATTDLFGGAPEPVPLVDGRLDLALRAWQIATLRLR